MRLKDSFLPDLKGGRAHKLPCLANLMFMVSQQELIGQMDVFSAGVINCVADEDIATTPVIHWHMNAHGAGALSGSVPCILGWMLVLETGIYKDRQRGRCCPPASI